ncbi:MAG: ASCH domain-containing protein [Paludibaculum sp.]
MITLSVRQPWAWCLFHGKGIENRDWPTSYRGRLAIHASTGLTKREYYDALTWLTETFPDLAKQVPTFSTITRGAVLGTVEVVGCISTSIDPWFFGPYGHVYANAKLFPTPFPALGKQKFWDWRAPAERTLP